MRTMLMILIKCLLLFSTVTGINGSRQIGKWDFFSLNQRTMKMILESCYENDSLSNPIIIFGDFNDVIDKASIIRMNSSLIVNEYHEKRQLLSAGASKVILTCDSRDELRSQLIVLKRTRWWKPEIPHFIIDRSNRPCWNVEDIMWTSWLMDMINSVYICAESMNKSVLITMNLMGDSAPYPWQRRKIFDPNFPKSYIFHQVFDKNSSCRHLNYDKTKLLRNYGITIVEWSRRKTLMKPGFNYINVFNKRQARHYKLLRSIIGALNASVKYEFENYWKGSLKRLLRGTADIAASIHPLQLFPNVTLGDHFPHEEETIIAVVKLKPEVSTLKKIRKLWSVQVLILAAIALAFLAAVLTIITRNFLSALLDVTRLLIYSAISTNNRSHAFRIYFTTMLIFMVISNGVFSGKIAAFLTTRERGDAPRTINELETKQYQIYTVLAMQNFAQQLFPKAKIGIEKLDVCIQLVINNTDHVCVITKSYFEQKYILKSLDFVELGQNSLLHFTSRQYWPLANRFNDMILRHVEAGIVVFWKANDTMVPRHKREAMEADWASPEYRPIKLYKLTFALQLLAIGLSLSSIVFFLELLMEKCGKVCCRRRNKVVQVEMRRKNDRSVYRKFTDNLSVNDQMIITDRFGKKK